MRLPLDRHLCEAVTGLSQPLAHPGLVANLAIGQSTQVSQRVKANVFYRGLVFHKHVHIGDTLRTTTEIVGLRQNTAKPGRDATGVAALEIVVRDQSDEIVLRFWRCPMIPCRDATIDTGHTDTFDSIPLRLTKDQLENAVPKGWNIAARSARSWVSNGLELTAGHHYDIPARDTITAAPELARMTLNMAFAHTDAGASFLGRRLVYGGHTISMALAQVTRVLPGIYTVLGWDSCDHLAPVLEQDILSTRLTIGESFSTGPFTVRALQAESFVEREQPEQVEHQKVLDWKFYVLSEE